jgi:hypothetical protein
MRRRIRISLSWCGYLAIGLVVSAIVAWEGGALYRPNPDYIDEKGAPPPWIAEILRGTSYSEGSTSINTALVTLTIYGGELPPPSAISSRRVAVFKAGWPFRALWGWRTTDVPRTYIDMHGGIYDFPDRLTIALQKDVNASPWWLPKRCFYGPLLPGLALDTVLCATLVWGARQAWRRAAAFLRAGRMRAALRRHVCPQCGYDLSGVSEPCPECGWSSRSATAES